MTAIADAPVQMRAGRPTGEADPPDHLARLDMVSPAHPLRIQMAIDVVIGTGPNLHAHTTGGVLDGLDHLARPPGPHRGMERGGDIKPVVGLRLSVRTDALSVMTGVAEKLVDRKHPMGPGADGLASGWFSLAPGEQEDEQWPERPRAGPSRAGGHGH